MRTSSSSSSLTGRESLVRLIGKRKRTCSAHLHHLLLHQSKEKKEEEPVAVPAGVSGSGDDKIGGGGPEFVPCPVCGVSILGTDYNVNSHLDACLARGTKRKMTQRTLLQLNFSSVPESKSYSGGLSNPAKDSRESELFSEREYNDSHMTVKTCSFNNCKENNYTLNPPDCFLSNSKKCIEDPLENKVIGDIVPWNAIHEDSSNMFLQATSLPKLKAFGSEDTKLMATLETFIVGRKFHDNVKLQEGTSISIIRDHQNPKDRLAIKVLSADPGSGQMLGYLPRELAKFLSPLIDNHHIECKGSVVSLPEYPLDVVPVQLVCQKIVASSEDKCDDYQMFESLWENVLRATEYAKTFPPSMTKYQNNFRLMIDDVMKNYAHLFTSSEKLFLGAFNTLGDSGQRLFIRLYTRKGPWFRMSNISYPEISDPQKAIEELKSAGYIFSFDSVEDIIKYDLKEVLEVLNVSEMKEIANLQLAKEGIKCARRQDLLDSLFATFKDGTCPLLPKMVLEQAGTCIKISSTADVLLWRVQRLFFLNGEQDLSSFLLVDLGIIKFPEYTCIVIHPIFQCRNDLLEYEEAIELAQILDESLDENNVERVIGCINISDRRMLTNFWQDKCSVSDSPPTFFSCFSAACVYSKVLLLGISFFERERRYVDAIMLLRGLLSRIICDSRRGYWTLRLSVDLEHIGRVNESLSVAEEGVGDPWVRAGSKMALQRRVLRLGKPPRRWKIPSYADSVNRKIKEINIRGRPLTSETGSKNLFYGFDGEMCVVEQLALQYYAEEGGGWKGVHSESGIWMTIFGILMWDVMLTDVPDVFHNRFQVAPLDLCTDNFYVARKTLAESHLQKIQDGMAEEILITSWELHFGTACQGVNWERHLLSDLRAVVSCIGGNCLASLCRHLALDYKNWSRGMPDLLLWRFHGGDGDGGEAKLVEVKGPRDRLSEQQRAWMLILTDCGFDAEVCKVSPNPKS